MLGVHHQHADELLSIHRSRSGNIRDDRTVVLQKIRGKSHTPPAQRRTHARTKIQKSLTQVERAHARTEQARARISNVTQPGTHARTRGHSTIVCKNFVSFTHTLTHAHAGMWFGERRWVNVPLALALGLVVVVVEVVRTIP